MGMGEGLGWPISILWIESISASVTCSCSSPCLRKPGECLDAVRARVVDGGVHRVHSHLDTAVLADVARYLFVDIRFVQLSILCSITDILCSINFILRSISFTVTKPSSSNTPFFTSRYDGHSTVTISASPHSK